MPIPTDLTVISVKCDSCGHLHEYTQYSKDFLIITGQFSHGNHNTMRSIGVSNRNRPIVVCNTASCVLKSFNMDTSFSTGLAITEEG